MRSLRGVAMGILVMFVLVLVMHVGVMSMMEPSSSCHALASQTSCIVTDTLERSLVAPLVSFVTAIVVLGVVARVQDERKRSSVFAFHRTHDLALAVVAPAQRALWRGSTQRRDDGAARACVARV